MIGTTPPTPLQRRTFLFGAGALALALTGCNGSAQPEAAGPASGSAGFSYTDARGTKIELPALPTVVVAQSSAAAALWDAGFKVKGAYGELKETDGRLDYQAGNLQLAELTVVGSTYGEFNVEKYAALAPQLLVDLSFDDQTLWYVPKDSATKIEALAPSLGVKMLNLDLTEIITSFMDLAKQLGADVTAPAVVSAKAAFEKSVEEIRAAVAAKPDLTVLAVSRAADKVYVSNADQAPDLAYLKSLGVRFVDHKGKATDYFSEVSWEEIDKFSGDLVFDDSRNYASRKDTDAKPTWRALSAVKAGQVFDWKPAAPYSYAANAPIFADIAQALTGADAVV
jgi:iron complex transport system substrate-binding protein